MKACLSPVSEKFHAIALVVLAAFVFRALLPAGFMPVFLADGHATMVICSGYGEKTVDIDGQKPDGGGAGHPAKQVCGFSVNTAGLDAPVFTLLPVVAPASTDILAPRAARQAFPLHAYLTRGPPSA